MSLEWLLRGNRIRVGWGGADICPGIDKTKVRVD